MARGDAGCLHYASGEIPTRFFQPSPSRSPINKRAVERFRYLSCLSDRQAGIADIDALFQMIVGQQKAEAKQVGWCRGVVDRDTEQSRPAA